MAIYIMKVKNKIGRNDGIHKKIIKTGTNSFYYRRSGKYHYRNDGNVGSLQCFWPGILDIQYAELCYRKYFQLFCK